MNRISESIANCFLFLEAQGEQWRQTNIVVLPDNTAWLQQSALSWVLLGIYSPEREKILGVELVRK